MNKVLSSVCSIAIVISAVFSVSLSALAQQADITIKETVRGNEEQPKVITIVPWQSPSGPQYLYHPLNSRLDHIFAPVERAELRRQLHFIDISHQDEAPLE